ncbi:hypothetical protein G9A89_010886 [Geosiphon pyriformis]|nr:hypothetical protein G9A89_010886 [Geosiphon pyriformis]
MGIKSLTKLLQRHAAEALVRRTIHDYKNKSLAIDASVFMRRFVKGVPIGEESHQYPHILGFYHLTMFLKQHKIRPIFVFDGTTRAKEKYKELLKRRALREKIQVGLKFEEGRKTRMQKWEKVVKRMNKLEEIKSEFVTAGIKEVAIEKYKQLEEDHPGFVTNHAKEAVDQRELSLKSADSYRLIDKMNDKIGETEMKKPTEIAAPNTISIQDINSKISVTEFSTLDFHSSLKPEIIVSEQDKSIDLNVISKSPSKQTEDTATSPSAKEKTEEMTSAAEKLQKISETISNLEENSKPIFFTTPDEQVANIPDIASITLAVSEASEKPSFVISLDSQTKTIKENSRIEYKKDLEISTIEEVKELASDDNTKISVSLTETEVTNSEKVKDFQTELKKETGLPMHAQQEVLKEPVTLEVQNDLKVSTTESESSTVNITELSMFSAEVEKASTVKVNDLKDSKAGVSTDTQVEVLKETPIIEPKKSLEFLKSREEKELVAGYIIEGVGMEELRSPQGSKKAQGLIKTNVFSLDAQTISLTNVIPVETKEDLENLESREVSEIVTNDINELSTSSVEVNVARKEELKNPIESLEKTDSLEIAGVNIYVLFLLAKAIQNLSVKSLKLTSTESVDTILNNKSDAPLVSAAVKVVDKAIIGDDEQLEIKTPFDQEKKYVESSLISASVDFGVDKNFIDKTKSEIDKAVIPDEEQELKVTICEEQEKIQSTIKESLPLRKAAQYVVQDAFKTVAAMSQMGDEKSFKKRYPEFSPTEEVINLKKDVEIVVKDALNDVQQLVSSQAYTRKQFLYGQLELEILDTIVARKPNEGMVQDVSVESHNYFVDLQKRFAPITTQMVTESQAFLHSLGMPCLVVNDHEAEAMCAALTASGICDASVTEDMDTVLFGDGPFLRFFLFKNRPILEVSAPKARQSLELSQDAFIDVCILCGTDFAGTIRGIGPIKAYKLVKQHGSIERVIENLDRTKYFVEPNFMDDVKAARMIFKNPPPVPKFNPGQLDVRPMSDHLDDLLQKYEIRDDYGAYDFNEIAWNLDEYNPSEEKDLLDDKLNSDSKPKKTQTVEHSMLFLVRVD